MTNYSSRDMSIHDDVDLIKALQTPRPKLNFQVGDSQIETRRELVKIFDAETQIPNRDALLAPPDLLMKKISKLPRVEDHIAPPKRVDP